MAKILWMDDYAGKGSKDRIGFDGLVFFIENNGHTVEIASTRERMEGVIPTISSYDLLILDIIMEPLTGSSLGEHQYGGMDVLERLKASTPLIPIIILSVMPSRLIKEEAERRSLDLADLGVREVKRKGSLTPTALAALVETYLRSGGAIDERNGPEGRGQ